MVNVSALGSARPSEWLSASTDWQNLGTDLGDIADEVSTEVAGVISRGSWTGKAATTAHARMQATVNALEAAEGEVNAVSDVLEGLGQAMTVCQKMLQDAQQLASRYGLTISTTGTVSASDGNIFEKAFDDVSNFVDDKHASAPQVSQVQDLVTEALRRATQIDQEAAAELRKIASHADQTNPDKTYGDNANSNADGLTASRLELQMIYQSIPTGPPSVVSQWWASLSSSEKTTLMEAAPGTLGTLAGIPASVRAQLAGNTGVNRVTLVNYALDNTFKQPDDVDIDNCTNFVSDGLLAAGLREIGHYPAGRSSTNNWYKTDVPVNSLDKSVAGATRSYTWADASDLHAFLTQNGSKEVPYSQAQPGDVVFYKDPSEGIYHAAVVTAKVNGQIFYTQHTPGEQNASWESRQSMPDNANPNDPTSIVVVQPGQDNPPVPNPQPNQAPSPPAAQPSTSRPTPDPQPNQAP